MGVRRHTPLIAGVVSLAQENAELLSAIEGVSISTEMCNDYQVITSAGFLNTTNTAAVPALRNLQFWMKK